MRTANYPDDGKSLFNTKNSNARPSQSQLLANRLQDEESSLILLDCSFTQVGRHLPVTSNVNSKIKWGFPDLERPKSDRRAGSQTTRDTYTLRGIVANDYC